MWVEWVGAECWWRCAGRYDIALKYAELNPPVFLLVGVICFLHGRSEQRGQNYSRNILHMVPLWTYAISHQPPSAGSPLVAAVPPTHNLLRTTKYSTFHIIATWHHA